MHCAAPGQAVLASGWRARAAPTPARLAMLSGPVLALALPDRAAWPGTWQASRRHLSEQLVVVVVPLGLQAAVQPGLHGGQDAGVEHCVGTARSQPVKVGVCLPGPEAGEPLEGVQLHAVSRLTGLGRRLLEKHSNL